MSNSIGNIQGLGGCGSLFQIGAQSIKQRHEDLFSKIDIDSDGGIDKIEFSAFAKKLSEMSGNTVSADDVFSTYDTDGDGSLSSDELKSFMQDNAPPPPPPNGMGGLSTMPAQSDNLFSKLDGDGDEKISKTEFSSFSEKLSEKSGDTVSVDDVFSTYDTDGDGSLSSDELKSFMQDNPPPFPPSMNKARAAYGTDQGADQTSSLMDFLKNLSSGSDSESSTLGDTLNAYFSKLIESLGDGRGNSLFSVTA